jgi:hypothetical protein
MYRMFRFRSSRVAPAILGVLLVVSALTFIGAASADLPAGCTSSGPGTATCTYTFYADAAPSTGAQCYDSDAGTPQPALDTSNPSAGSAYADFCTVYAGPDIDVTSVTANVYLGLNILGGVPVASNLYSSTSDNSFDSGSGAEVAGGTVANSLPVEGSCATPTSFSDVSMAVSGGSYSLNTGVILLFVPNAGSGVQTCTGGSTPTSFTMTGTLVGAITTTTSTSTSVVTSTSTTTVTSDVTVGYTSTSTSTTGACTGQPHSPANADEQSAPQPAPVTTSTEYIVTATATTTITTEVLYVTTSTGTTTQTTLVLVPTCTTSTTQASGVPQFPIPNLSAVLLAALLLPVIALMARARRSSAPVLSA